MDSTIREAFAVREFCARYGICRQTFYDEVKRGRIKAKKLGKKTLVLRADAENWAASLPVLDLRDGVIRHPTRKKISRLVTSLAP
jgi:excisionase family DNA binding protein